MNGAQKQDARVESLFVPEDNTDGKRVGKLVTETGVDGMD